MENVKFLSIKERRWIDELTVSSFNSDELSQSLDLWLASGQLHTKSARLDYLKLKRHNLFLDYIAKVYEFPLVDDVSAGLALQDLSIALTPDAYQPSLRRWADVAVSNSPGLTYISKKEAYKKLLIYEWQKYKGGDQNKYNFDIYEEPRLEVYVYNPSSSAIYIYSCNYNPDSGAYEDQGPFVTSDCSTELHNAMFVSSNLIHKFSDRTDQESEIQSLEKIAVCKEYPPLEVLIDLNQGYGGIINKFVERGSFDSEKNIFQKFSEDNEAWLDDWADKMADNIHTGALEGTPFKKVKSVDIREAYKTVEEKIKKDFIIMDVPKPSLHGSPVLSDTLLKEQVGDTKEFVINNFLMDLSNKKSRGPLFRELFNVMLDRVETFMANKSAYNNESIFKQMNHTEQMRIARDKDELWKRGCLKFKKNSNLLLHMGVNKKSDKVELRVKTVDFGNKSQFLPIELEIRRKVMKHVGVQYDIHRDHKPYLDSIGHLYWRFISSELFQEICCNAKMAENILIACAKPKKGGFLINSGSANYLALVGENSGFVNRGAKVPICYISKNPAHSNLWFNQAEWCGEWAISKADRLDKARMESVADSARLASVLASIVLTTVEGEPEDKLFVAGLFACVATSVNIRDSGLLDHVRYVIPNVFSEYSCAADYIKDKMGVALKTELQGLLYQKIRKCVFESVESVAEEEEVTFDGGEVLTGGTAQKIKFCGVKIKNLFFLNGLFYSAYFACKKGLHVPETECKIMLETITKFESLSKNKTILEASKDRKSRHYYDGELIARGTMSMCKKDYDQASWRKMFLKNDSFKPCYKLRTFTSMRSSLKCLGIINPVEDFLKKFNPTETLDKNLNIKRPSAQMVEKQQNISRLFKNVYSDDRTRVVDQFFDRDETVWELAIKSYEHLIEGRNTGSDKNGLFATWDLKRQRSDRDREIYIVNTMFKCLAHCVEMTSKVVCDRNENEQITSPGDLKTLNLKQESRNFFDKIKELKKYHSENKNPAKIEERLEQVRATLDMTKWAPGDNLSKFCFFIAGLPFLKKNEKMLMMNFLILMTEKKIILNKTTNSALANLSANHGIDTERGSWCKMMEHTTINRNGVEVVDQFKENTVPVRFSWLMGILNYTSSAVHAVSVYLVEKALKNYYHDSLILYKPSVHSDDASCDLIIYHSKEMMQESEVKFQSKIDLKLKEDRKSVYSVKRQVRKEKEDYFSKKRTAWLVYPEVLQFVLKETCIRISEKKSYLHPTRKEFVSELNMNGMNSSYWQKQALACITGFSYTDYYKDICDACSKINSLVSMGGPPSVVNVCLSNVLSLAKETYGLGKNQKNNPESIIPGLMLDQLPTELGGSFDMNPYLLPIVGVKYQNFKRMMAHLLQLSKKKNIDDITEEKDVDIINMLKATPADLISRAWIATAELSAEEDINLSPIEGSLITFRQFNAREKIKSYRMSRLLEEFPDETIRMAVERDPSIPLRAPTDFYEKTIQFAALLRKPKYMNALALNSPDQLKLERILNRYNKCCQPSYGEKLLSMEEKMAGSPMDRANMTFKEALIDILNRMIRINLNMYDVLKMLKNLPLFCYVYSLETSLKFERASGRKSLYAVRKFKSVTEEAVHSNPGTLLKVHFNGETSGHDDLNYQHLLDDLEVVKQYDKLFSNLDGPERAVAIHKMLIFPTSLSSLVYVPSPHWTGYKIILGLLCNSFYDHHNAWPDKKVQPFKLEYKFRPIKSKLSSKQQQLSDLICVMKNLFFDERLIKEYAQTVRIEGEPVNDILASKENFRESLYARVALGKLKFNRRDPQDWELIYIDAQTKLSMRGTRWIGDFRVGMVCPFEGEFQKRRFLVFYGNGERIREIKFFGDPENFPDLKRIIMKFMEGMNWWGHIRDHLEYKEQSTTNSMSFYVKSFELHSQIRFAQLYVPSSLDDCPEFKDGILYRNERGFWRISGVPFSQELSINQIPYFVYDGVTKSGIIQSVMLGKLKKTREINHYLHSDPDFTMDYFVNDIFVVKNLIYDVWDSVRNKSKLDIMYCRSILENMYSGPLPLPFDKVQDINFLYHHHWVAIKDIKNINWKVERNDPFISSINKDIFTWLISPDQDAFNINLSSSLLCDARKARTYAFMASPEMLRNFEPLSVSQMYRAIYQTPTSRFYFSKPEGRSLTLFINDDEKQKYENYISEYIGDVDLDSFKSYYPELPETTIQADLDEAMEASLQIARGKSWADVFGDVNEGEQDEAVENDTTYQDIDPDQSSISSHDSKRNEFYKKVLESRFLFSNEVFENIEKKYEEYKQEKTGKNLSEEFADKKRITQEELKKKRDELTMSIYKILQNPDIRETLDKIESSKTDSGSSSGFTVSSVRTVESRVFPFGAGLSRIREEKKARLKTDLNKGIDVFSSQEEDSELAARDFDSFLDKRQERLEFDWESYEKQRDEIETKDFGEEVTGLSFSELLKKAEVIEEIIKVDQKVKESEIISENKDKGKQIEKDTLKQKGEENLDSEDEEFLEFDDENVDELASEEYMKDLLRRFREEEGMNDDFTSEIEQEKQEQERKEEGERSIVSPGTIEDVPHSRTIQVYNLFDALGSAVIVNKKPFFSQFIEPDDWSINVTLKKGLVHDGSCSMQALDYFINDEEVLINFAKRFFPRYNPNSFENWLDQTDIMNALCYFDIDIVIISGNQVLSNFDLKEKIGRKIFGIAVDGVFTDIANILIRD